MDLALQARVREALLRLRDDSLAEGAVNVKVDRDSAVASATDEDAAPLIEMGQSIASARNRARSERIAKIDAALQRLGADPDSYGICEECGDDIAPGRLVAMPFASMCVPCQSRKEQGKLAVRKRTDR
jgi:DnaK suppressor protein